MKMSRDKKTIRVMANITLIVSFIFSIHRNTADLIEGTVKKVNDGGELVGTTDEAFTQVAESSAKVGELVGEIAAASNEQAEGIEQVNKAVGDIFI